MIKQLLLLLFALNLALANLTDEGQTAYDAGDEKTAAKIWQKACESGEARGCVRLGFLYQSGRGVKQDDAKAGKFYQKACDTGELSSCDSLASLYQNSGEHAKAAAIFEQACEKGFGLSCYNLAQIYEAGLGVASDESKALDLYVKACERGYAVVCYYLGGMYADGAMGKNDEAAKNSKNALKFYSLACDGKIYEACEALGRLYEDGEAGFAQDIKVARSYYDKACAANAYKCSGSERLDELQGGWAQYQSGQFKAAYELGKESCDRGVANGCAALGELYAKGLGGARQDSEQAVKFREQACEGGFGASCAKFGEMLSQGRGAKKDAQRALWSFLKRPACFGGWMLARA